MGCKPEHSQQQFCFVYQTQIQQERKATEVLEKEVPTKKVESIQKKQHCIFEWVIVVPESFLHLKFVAFVSRLKMQLKIFVGMQKIIQSFQFKHEEADTENVCSLYSPTHNCMKDDFNQSLDQYKLM